MDIEHNFVEYKSGIEAKADARDFKAEIVSFLNSRTGGIIYLGANDDGTPVEFATPEEKRSQYQAWEEKLANWITNAFAPDVTGLIFVDPTTEPMAIQISAGPSRPYYYKDGEGMNMKGVYTRVGSTRRRANDDEIRRMMIAGVAHLYEQQISGYDTLDFSYTSKRLASLGMEFNASGLNIKKPGENYNNAGVILSEQNPFVTKVAVFEGTTVDTFLDKKKYTGSICEQIDKTMDYMKLVIRERNIITGAAQRTVLPDYSPKATREAILNCYCHRDLTMSADILIWVFDDRIEVSSPGGPPEGLSLELILKGAHAKRNPILVEALDKLDYIENYNSGIQRILSEYEGFALQPEFVITDALFKVVLYNKNYYYDSLKSDDTAYTDIYHDNDGRINGRINGNINDIEQMLLEAISQNGKITVKELAIKLNIGERTAHRITKELRERGLLERVGARKKGHWVNR
jgi:predicted HTH transcriptional regulator